MDIVIVHLGNGKEWGLILLVANIDIIVHIVVVMNIEPHKQVTLSLMMGKHVQNVVIDFAINGKAMIILDGHLVIE